MADVASLKREFDAMSQRVQADLAKLRQQLAQAQSKSALSAEDQKALDDMEQTAKALDPTDPTTLGDVNAAPAAPAPSAPTT